MVAALAPIKVDVETDTLVSHAAHFLGTSKKDIVDRAVREYVERRRDEIQAAALEALQTLDGSTARAVQLLTNATAEELIELGGFSR